MLNSYQIKKADIPYSKEESKAFILCYCAQIDFTLSLEELEYMKSKTNSDNITKAYKEICKSNDFQIIQRIQTLVDNYWRTEVDKNNLLKDIWDLFLTDGKCNQMERNLYRGLNQLFASNY